MLHTGNCVVTKTLKIRVNIGHRTTSTKINNTVLKPMALWGDPIRHNGRLVQWRVNWRVKVCKPPSE